MVSNDLNMITSGTNLEISIGPHLGGRRLLPATAGGIRVRAMTAEIKRVSPGTRVLEPTYLAPMRLS